MQEAAAAAAAAAEQHGPPDPGRDQKISLSILRVLKQIRIF